MSYQFLLEFSQQSLPPEQIVRNFYTGCPGRNDELSDVRTTRRTGRSPCTRSPRRFRSPSTSPASAPSGTRAATAARRCRSSGHPPVSAAIRPFARRASLTPSTGTDQTTAVYRQDRWWLCDSDFNVTVGICLPAGLHPIAGLIPVPRPLAGQAGGVAAVVLGRRHVLRRRDALLDEGVPLVAVRALPEQFGAAVVAALADVRIEIEDRLARQFGVAADRAPGRGPDATSACQMAWWIVRACGLCESASKQQFERVGRAPVAP